MIADEVSRILAARMAGGASPEELFDELSIAVATFIAASHGSPVDHRYLAEQFAVRVNNEIPKARHRLARIARESNG